MNWRCNRYGRRLLPGGLMTLVFALLLKLGALQPLEQIAYSTLFRLRGEVAWDDRLVLVAIDDASIQKLGRFPWSRHQYVKLLNILSKANSEVVAIDLIWSEPSPDDAQLGQAMAQHGRVVLSQAQDMIGLPLLPVAQLRDAAIATGSVVKPQDTDGITRKVDLLIQGEPSLGLATVQAYQLVQDNVSLPALNQPLWINWPGSVQRVRQYSFADVIQHKVPSQVFQDKIVLVGVTAIGLDPLVTPFDRNPPASGVHLNAVVISNILQHNALYPLAQNWSWLILLLGGPGLAWLFRNWGEARQLLFLAALCCSWAGLSLLLFQVGYWPPVAFPLGLFTATTVATVLSERLWMNQLLQQQVQRLWQKYQKDMVVRRSDTDELNTLTQQQTGLVHIEQLTALAEQLGRSQSTQAAIARSLSIGLLAADLDGLVWFCNPVASKWLNIQVGDYLSAQLELSWINQDEWQTALQTLEQQTQVPPKEFQHDDRWFELKLEPLSYRPVELVNRHETERFDGLLIVLEDITARKQIEVTLEQQVQELQHMAQLKDEFLSTVSHELRAPLANMKMAIELLKLADPSERTARYLKILQAECSRETDLINDLLDLQRLEEGARKYHMEEIQLQEWLPPIVEPFYERAEAYQQTLQMQLISPLPALVSDQAGLERILVELINNACKYTPPEGKIRVTANWAPPHVELVVENSGAEIPAAELPRIFEKFYRVPQADPWKRGGTGLGLALVKKLVTCLGGTIEVQSGSGQTTFIVQLPTASSTNGTATTDE